MKKIKRLIMIFLCKQYMKMFAKRYFAGKKITQSDSDTFVFCCNYLAEEIRL